MWTDSPQVPLFWSTTLLKHPETTPESLNPWNLPYHTQDIAFGTLLHSTSLRSRVVEDWAGNQPTYPWDCFKLQPKTSHTKTQIKVGHDKLHPTLEENIPTMDQGALSAAIVCKNPCFIWWGNKLHPTSIFERKWNTLRCPWTQSFQPWNRSSFWLIWPMSHTFWKLAFSGSPQTCHGSIVTMSNPWKKKHCVSWSTSPFRPGPAWLDLVRWMILLWGSYMNIGPGQKIIYGDVQGICSFFYLPTNAGTQ